MNWNHLPLLHDDITELVDVRDLVLLHLLFQDAPQMLSCHYQLGLGLETCWPFISFTLSFFSKAVAILEECLGSLPCWNTALRPSFPREGIMLCFSMSQYMLAFMVPLMNYRFPVPVALIQSQTHYHAPCTTTASNWSLWLSDT